ncbi:MAG: hypothetical protein EOM50_02245 [Erysipelotrichia bacterium]|nr:hypothetical protein [Erysipelotrichia bacterium]
MKKALGTGIQDYRKLIENDYYYVDKTLLIEDFMKDGSEVSLITRPRRFGKTLNMSMLAEFFDISKDSQAIFAGMHIMQSEYATFMNCYPVIFLSFKDVKGDYFSTIRILKETLFNEYRRYRFIISELDVFDKPRYDYVIENLNKQDEDNLTAINTSIRLLCQLLYEYYGKKVMLFIDEYDTPFIEAYNQNFYERVHGDLSTLLSTALKGNEYLEKAMITGIQRIAKENIFSGLNNLSVYGVDKEKYANYFGLNEEETKILLQYYDLSLSEEVKAMYDGYRIGGLELYNPWSIINYAQEQKLIPYWVNTASNMMIKNLMSTSDVNFKQDYEQLIEKGYVDVEAKLDTSYFEEENTLTLWALLINAGYLTIMQSNDYQNYRVCIPNDEVKEAFKELTMHYLKTDIVTFTKINTALKKEDIQNFVFYYQQFLKEVVSYYDTLNENSYHMLMLGLCAYMHKTHEVISNQEVGLGRCDLQLKSRTQQYPSYVLEFKYTKDGQVDLKQLAKQGIKQIMEKQYDMGLQGKVYYIGLAHRGKEVEVLYQERSSQK